MSTLKTTNLQNADASSANIVLGQGSGGGATISGITTFAGNAQFNQANPQLEFNSGGARFWSPAANTLTIHTGGGFDSTSLERLRIDSSGRVGIGTNVADYGLHVYGAGDILIEDKDNGSAHLRLRSSENGTDSSNWKIKTSSDNKFYIENDTLGGASDVIIDPNGNTKIIGITTAAAFAPSVGWLGNRNLIINGAMQITQRGTSFADPADNAYTLDRWKTRNSSGDPAFTWTADSETPDGFASSLKCDCTTADTSLAAGDFHRLEYHFEGRDLQPFAKGTASAKKGVLSFYVKTNKTGTYVVNFYDNDNSRGFSAAYTVANSNWNRYTISIPADTTGAWGNDNGGSLSVNWGLAIGSTRNSGSTGDLPTAWGSHASNTQFAGQVNFADSTSNNFYLTGVQLEVGEHATPFEHRSYAYELERCKRYYQQYPQSPTNDNFTPLVSSCIACHSTQEGYWAVDFRPSLRNPPSFSHTGNFRANGSGVSNLALTTMGIYHNGTSSTFMYARVSSGFTAGIPCVISTNNDATACIKFDAEL